MNFLTFPPKGRTPIAPIARSLDGYFPPVFLIDHRKWMDDVFRDTSPRLMSLRGPIEFGSWTTVESARSLEVRFFELKSINLSRLAGWLGREKNRTKRRTPSTPSRADRSHNTSWMDPHPKKLPHHQPPSVRPRLLFITTGAVPASRRGEESRAELRRKRPKQGHRGDHLRVSRVGAEGDPDVQRRQARRPTAQDRAHRRRRRPRRQPRRAFVRRRRRRTDGDVQRRTRRIRRPRRAESRRQSRQRAARKEGRRGRREGRRRPRREGRRPRR